MTAGLLLTTINVCNAQDAQPTVKPAPASADRPQADKRSGPRLTLSKREWNFGQLWHGDPCSTEVELRNVGDAALKIIDIKSSCGCATAKPKKKELAPGETDTMTVTYQTTKNAKKVTQTITIITNDPVEPQMRFLVKGEVWHVFDAKPNARMVFGFVKPESKKTTSIELHNNLKEKVFPQLKPLRPDECFELELEEIEPGMKYKLIARTKPPLKPGTNYVTATLETGVERLPTMSITVSAVALEPVSVRPDRVWVVPSQTRPSRRTLWLNYAEDHPVKITELKSSHPKVRVQKLSAGRSPGETSEFTAHQIRVFLPPFADLPDEPVTIEIRTDDPDPKFQKFVVFVEKRRPGQPLVGEVKPNAGQKPQSGQPAGEPD